MNVNALSLFSYRNYSEQNIDFDPECNVIYGENAQGKTNLLEAIDLLTSGKSFRTHSDKELISFDKENAKISGNIHSRNRDFLSEIVLYKTKQKKITINDIKVKNHSDLSSVLHTVFFSPDDLFLIKEGAAERRKFMDKSLCQLRPNYAKALLEYNKLYENKTRILRDSEEYPDLLKTLPEYNEKMVQTGSVLIHYRALFCERLCEYAALAHQECSGNKEKLLLSYQTVKTVENPLGSISQIQDNLRLHQESHYYAEISSKSCLSGPHKDDLMVTINGQGAKQYASQGQIRTAALSMKLAEREIHKNVFGEFPVMLLDDVLSELDPKRQEYVLNRIQGGQIFITCCENDRLDALLKGRVFHIQGGKVIL